MLGRATGWIMLWFVAVFLWQAVVLVINNHGYGTRSFGLLNTPLWIPQTIMAAGLTLLMGTVLAGLALAEPAARRGRIPAGLAILALAAAALVWLGPRPMAIGRSVID